MLVFGKKIAIHGGSESALRADGELIEWDETGSLVDATLEIFLAFEFRALRADQSKDDCLALGDEAERFKGTGSFVIVFEQEAVHGELVEEALGDRVVSAFCVPVTAIVAAA